MATLIGLAGKIAAMEGIETLIASIKLYNSVGAVVATTSVTGTSFATSGTTGQLSNTSAIDFTIGAEDVGDVATYVQLLNAAGTGILLQIDLDTSVTLTTEGTATFAIGALTADL